MVYFNHFCFRELIIIEWIKKKKKKIKSVFLLFPVFPVSLCRYKLFSLSQHFSLKKLVYNLCDTRILDIYSLKFIVWNCIHLVIVFKIYIFLDWHFSPAFDTLNILHYYLVTYFLKRNLLWFLSLFLCV